MNYIHFFIVCKALSTYETGEMIDSERGHIKWKLDEYKEKLAVDRKKLRRPYWYKKWLGWRGKWHKVVAKVIFDGYYSTLWECVGQKKYRSANE